MDDVKRFTELKQGEVNVVAPPRIMTLMSGVEWAEQHQSGAITLHYTDGSTETAQPKQPVEIADMEFFAIVSLVQSMREQ